MAVIVDGLEDVKLVKDCEIDHMRNVWGRRLRDNWVEVKVEIRTSIRLPDEL